MQIQGHCVHMHVWKHLCTRVSLCLNLHVQTATCAGANPALHAFEWLYLCACRVPRVWVPALLNLLHAGDSNVSPVRAALEAPCAPPHTGVSSCLCACTLTCETTQTLSSTGSPSSGFIFRRIRQAQFQPLKCLPSLKGLLSLSPFVFHAPYLSLTA